MKKFVTDYQSLDNLFTSILRKEEVNNLIGTESKIIIVLNMINFVGKETHLEVFLQTGYLFSSNCYLFHAIDRSQ